tara:strand:- start:1510 stop:2301 length:792 start_codon:yes stop_codon:yes gene_type:complete
MSIGNKVIGLALKISPLGENDRLLTLLSNDIGIARLAVPGARRPKSSLSGVTPLTLLELDVIGRSSLKRVRQIKRIQTFNNIGKHIETLSAAQALTELIQLLVATNEPIPGILDAALIHLERLHKLTEVKDLESLHILAISVQSCIHLLALGGYGLPIQKCCKNGMPLEPPIGEWDWRCSLILEEGFAIGAIPNASIQLNPSELALLQRLLRPNLPWRSDGKLMGPKEVWIKLLTIIELWIGTHLAKPVRSLSILKEVILISR